MRIRLMSVLSASVVFSYLTYANASWVLNAVYVSRETGAPVWQVLDPLHRSWVNAGIRAR